MSYDALRHAADSWGLIFLGVVFVILIGWTFRRGAKAVHHRAANMIFEDDQHGG
jgi:cytochrome c oxidase cbb3-type subunit 4